LEEIKIKMLGHFSMNYNGIIIDETTRSSKKLWHLLEYLIYFKDRDNQEEDIVELLWGNSKNKDPLNSLKNILFRLRNILSDAGIENAKNIIVYSNAMIRFNTKLPIICDFEEFEKLCKLTINPILSEQEKREILIEAVNIYKGDFLNGKKELRWIAPINAYYHSLYVNVIDQLTEILDNQNDHVLLLEILTHCKTVAPKEEIVVYGLILANLKLGNIYAALKEYNNSGINLIANKNNKISEKGKKLYKLMAESIGSYEKDILTIQKSLEVINWDIGCLECPYEIFKIIYVLQKRDMERNNNGGFLILFTCQNPISNSNLKTIDFNKLNDDPVILNKQQGLEVLRNSIKFNLRTGDVMTKYSNNQYLVLVMNVYEKKDIEKIINRITKKINSKLRALDIKLETTFKKI